MKRKSICLLLSIFLAFIFVEEWSSQVLLISCQATQIEQNDYINQVADDYLSSLINPDMNEFQKVKTIYRELITKTSFGKPLGVNLWMYRGDATQIPDFVNAHALSPILFGIGSCEDYAAAMTILCRRSDLEAFYVPGLTISVEGEFVDHAWTVVKVDGYWYHVDPQLEDNIIKNGVLRYRYFLKGDEEMLADHRWGINWATYRQETNVDWLNALEKWTPPPCAVSYPPQNWESVAQAAVPDSNALSQLIMKEIERYKENTVSFPVNGQDTTPPMTGSY